MTPAGDVSVGDVSVVIACHSMDRWSHTIAAIDSSLGQQPRPRHVIVVVDNNIELYDRLLTESRDMIVLHNTGERGASATRNLGVEYAVTSLVAFLDDDAVARPGWLLRLIAPFVDPSVIGTGGGIAPAWEGTVPAWFPSEFGWAVGASYRGMPRTPQRVRNVWSGNMAVRRASFDAVAGFRRGFGKLGNTSRPEDTDFCIRVTTAVGGSWMYVPDAWVDHRVPQERGTFRFFVRRCYAEGRGKIAMSRLLGSDGSLGTEGDYLRRTLPSGVRRGVSIAVRRGELIGVARAGAIVVGAGASAVGAGRELLTGGVAGPSRDRLRPHGEAAA